MRGWRIARGIFAAIVLALSGGLAACVEGELWTGPPVTSGAGSSGAAAAQVAQAPPAGLDAWMAGRRASYAAWAAANPDHEARLAAFAKAAREAGARLRAEATPAGMAAGLKARSAAASRADVEAARQTFFQAFKLFQEGAFEAARNRFRQGLEKDPGNAPAHFYLAESLVRLEARAEARRHYELTAALDPASPEAAKAEVAAARLSAAAMGLVLPVVATVPGAGYVFRDCPECPEMVTIPPGRFNMGSPANEAGRDKDEGPQHGVAIGHAFAVGKYEVTRGEYAAFVAATGHSSSSGCTVFTGTKWEKSDAADWRDPGFRQTDRDPVVCVNWNDAKAYVAWLSKKTGKDYRLPTEAEWEYAARAGTETRRWWGNDAGDSEGCAHANVAGGEAKERFSGWTVFNCRDGHVFTAPVGSYRANGFGLHDVHGNVWEWVEDCWSESYAGAPVDGGAWTSGDCLRRVGRGGSWYDEPRFLRSADRGRDGTTLRNNSVGFRVSRTLD